MLPNVLYGSPVYSPPLLSLRSKLERIQRYFTQRLFKRMNYNLVFSNPCRLKLLGLVSLETAFARSDLLTLYKLINSQLPSTVCSFRFSTHVSHRLLLSRVKSDLARKHFIKRSSCLWNRVVSSDSVTNLNSFRKFLYSDAFSAHVHPRA